MHACESRRTRAEIKLDFDNGEYSRCEGTLCDTFPVNFREDRVLSLLVGRMERARGAHFVVDDDGTNFIESVTQSASTTSSFGNCVPEEQSS